MLLLCLDVLIVVKLSAQVCETSLPSFVCCLQVCLRSFQLLVDPWHFSDPSRDVSEQSGLACGVNAILDRFDCSVDLVFQ